MQVIDRLLAEFTKLAGEWESQARERVELVQSDPVAEALQLCARRLRGAVRTAEEMVDVVSTTDFAELHHVSRQTVNNWIKWGWLEADETESGYQIPRHAVPRKSRT